LADKTVLYNGGHTVELNEKYVDDFVLNHPGAQVFDTIDDAVRAHYGTDAEVAETPEETVTTTENVVETTPEDHEPAQQ
jgi:hypothetical protein